MGEKPASEVGIREELRACYLPFFDLTNKLFRLKEVTIKVGKSNEVSRNFIGEPVISFPTIALSILEAPGAEHDRTRLDATAHDWTLPQTGH